MQHTDNDMDDLFKKAGSEYPLNTGQGDWDAVAGRLQQPADANAPSAAQRPSKNRRWLFLLLLLPLGYFLRDLTDRTGVEEKHSANIQKTDESKENNEKELTTRYNENGEPAAAAPPGNVNNLERDGSITSDRPTSGLRPADGNDPVNRQFNTRERLNGENANNEKVGAQRETINSSTADNDRRFTAPKSADKRKPAIAGSHANKKQDRQKAAEGIPTVIPKRPEASLVPADHLGPDISEDALRNRRASVNWDLDFQKPFESLTSPSGSQPSEAASEHGKRKEPSGLPRIYVGVLGGPDASTIKMQRITKSGFNVALLGGYRINKRWSVETGIIYTQKQYYTDGKYFDKTRTGIPDWVYVKYLDGECKMFEIPLTVRYNFSTGANRFFVNGGLSSYIMKKESYHYLAYAASAPYESDRTYDNSGTHIFSNLHLSAGYNYRLSKSLQLRIEPYFKIPINDIGIGNLPITSAGIQLGVMKSFR